MATVAQTLHRLGTRNGLTTLEQQFRFAGDDATAVRIGDVLLTAPLTGVGSVFGDRPGEELTAPTPDSRILRGFSPAPGFRFDVHLERRDEGVFLVRFSQPDRRVPYLQGDIVWMFTDEGDHTMFREEINTEPALVVSSEPLTGDRVSVRRWLFFRVGHRQVMGRATGGIATLLSASHS